ncbi:MAG TPA: hypothetical protein VKP04_02430 [Ktedonobacteraceae bacterium]|nr:hypothetical protein [Ktedonobacteraceae bacterium]
MKATTLRLLGLLTILGIFIVPKSAASNALSLQGDATPSASQASEQCQAKGPIRQIALSADSRYLLTPWDKTSARLWDFKTGQVLHTFSPPQDNDVSDEQTYVVDVSFSPDGNYALLGKYDGVATLWNVKSGEKVRTFGEPGSIGEHQIQFSPDGKYILASYGDGAVLWDVQSGNKIRSFLQPLDLDYTNEFSSDSKFVLTGTTLWDVQTGQALHSFDGWAAKISPGGNYVSTLSGAGLQIWNAHTYKLMATLDTEYVPVAGVFSPDEKYILTYPNQTTVGLYNLQTGQQQIIFTFSGKLHYGIFLRDKPYLIVLEGQAQTTVHTWDLATNKEIGSVTLDVPLFYLPGNYLIVPNGDTIITASIADPNNLKTDTPLDADLIQLWDTKTGQLLRSFC